MDVFLALSRSMVARILPKETCILCLMHQKCNFFLCSDKLNKDPVSLHSKLTNWTAISDCFLSCFLIYILFSVFSLFHFVFGILLAKEKRKLNETFGYFCRVNKRQNTFSTGRMQQCRRVKQGAKLFSYVVFLTLVSVVFCSVAKRCEHFCCVCIPHIVK